MRVGKVQIVEYFIKSHIQYCTPIVIECKPGMIKIKEMKSIKEKDKRSKTIKTLIIK